MGRTTRDPTPLLDDIVKAIEEIEITLRKKTYKSYCAHFGTRRIVERCLQIVSEAADNLPATLKGTQPHINWRDVADFGNFLRHEYHHLQDKLVWDTATGDLPRLKEAVLAMRLAAANAGRPHTSVAAPRSKNRSRGKRRIRL
jgi:uncharacterized protein with HEPN domain